MEKRFKQQLVITAVVFVVPVTSLFIFLTYKGHQFRKQVQAQQALAMGVPIPELLAEADRLMAAPEMSDIPAFVLSTGLMEKVNPADGNSPYPTIRSLTPIGALTTPDGLVLEMTGGWGLVIGREGKNTDGLQHLTPNGARRHKLADRVIMYSTTRALP